MNPVVCKVASAYLARSTTAQVLTRIHRINNITVASRLALGVEPRLSIAWEVDPRCWSRDFSLLIFQSLSGFCAQRYPQDLNEHGSLIIETLEDSQFEFVPTEGQHFFTFVLHRRILLGLFERMGVLRFSETVPSAKVATGRIRDLSELQEMQLRHELRQIERESDLNGAKIRAIKSRKTLHEFDHPTLRDVEYVDPVIAEAKEDVDALVDALIAKKEKLSELKNNPKFMKLGPQDRKAVMDRIKDRFDAAEIGARREMRRSQKKG